MTQIDTSRSELYPRGKKAAKLEYLKLLCRFLLKEKPRHILSAMRFD
jgi:hypothetical protein